MQLTWEIETRKNISIDEIEEVLDIGDFTQESINELLNTKGIFSSTPEYKKFKNHKNWALFNKYAMNHVLFIKNKRTELYTQYKPRITEILNEVCDLVLNKVTNSDAIVLFYGTRAIKTFSNKLDNKWKNLSKKMSTLDIDIAVGDPKEFSILIYNYLVTYAKQTIWDNDIYITRVSLAEKTSDLYTISISIKVKYIGQYFTGRCESILDCTNSKYWNPETYLNISDNVKCQTPIHYICGLVDKLFNTHINPRILNETKKIAEMATREKIQLLSLPELNTNIKEEIDILIKISEGEQLSTYKNELSQSAAYNFLLNLLNNNKDDAFEIYDKWLISRL